MNINSSEKLKIRVLHISQVGAGIETYLNHIFENFDRMKFEMILACPRERKSLIAMAEENGISTVKIFMKWKISPFSDIKSIISLVKLINQLRPEIVHAHSSKAGFITRLAGIFCNVKIFYTPNAYAYLGYKGLAKHLFLNVERMLKPLTYCLLASSESEKNRSLIDLRFPANKVQVFPNSIKIYDLEQFPKHVKCERKQVITVGRLVKQKNPLMFLELCKKTIAERKDTEFRIIGAGYDDAFKTTIEDFVKTNNLENYFKIIPWMNERDLFLYIRNSDILVMTSLFESFGYVAAEAQILEIPVIATNVDGLNEIVEDGKTGFLVDVNDVDGMNEKIRFLLDNDNLAKEMGKIGRTRVSEKFDIKQNIKKLESAYLSA